MRWLDQQAVAEGWPERAFNAAGYTSSQDELEPTAVVDLTTSWEEYLASRTSKWRNNYKRWLRRLEERGIVEHVRYRPQGTQFGEDDPRWDLYDTCEALARRSWQCSDNDTVGTTLSHDSVRPFFRAMHEAAVKAGGLDLNLLLVNHEPVAFAYNYFYNGIIYGLRIGYDASLAQHGAGNLLYCRAIQDSFARHDRLYDFGPGSLDAKKYLWTRQEPIFARIAYASFAWRSQLVRLKRSLSKHGDIPSAAAAVCSTIVTHLENR